MKSQSYPGLRVLIQADRKYQYSTNRRKDLHALRYTKQSTVSTSFKILALVENWVLFLSVVFLHMMSCGEAEKHLLLVYLKSYFYFWQHCLLWRLSWFLKIFRQKKYLRSKKKRSFSRTFTVTFLKREDRKENKKTISFFLMECFIWVSQEISTAL